MRSNQKNGHHITRFKMQLQMLSDKVSVTFKSTGKVKPSRPLGLLDIKSPHLLVSRLTDGGEAVLLASPPLSTPFPSKISGTHFWQGRSWPQTYFAAGGIRSTEKSSDLIGYGNRDLPASSLVPNQLHYITQPPVNLYSHNYL
jgi:hypothetical protein